LLDGKPSPTADTQFAIYFLGGGGEGGCFSFCKQVWGASLGMRKGQRSSDMEPWMTEHVVSGVSLLGIDNEEIAAEIDSW